MATIDSAIQFNISNFLQPNYKGFLEKFYEDWTNTFNAFSNPIERTCVIRRMIICLINNNNLDEAIKIFNVARKKDAWNPNVGALRLEGFTNAALENICRVRMVEARCAITQACKK